MFFVFVPECQRILTLHTLHRTTMLSPQCALRRFEAHGPLQSVVQSHRLPVGNELFAGLQFRCESLYRVSPCIGCRHS